MLDLELSAQIVQSVFVKPPREVAQEEGNMDPRKDYAHLARVQRMADRVEAGMTPDGRGWEPSESEDRKDRLSALFNM